MDEDINQPRPCFIPENCDWETLPADVRAAVRDIVMPLYREYVLENGDVLQRSAGLSLAYLVTLEVIEQVSQGRLLFQPVLDNDDDMKDRSRRMDRYLRLLGAKQKYTDLLVRLKSWREKAIVGRVHP